MFTKPYLLQFPVWKFLKQPVFNSDYKTVLNPKHFWHFHRVELLERCLVMDYTSKDSRRE